jgi:hypothetical protein
MIEKTNDSNKAYLESKILNKLMDESRSAKEILARRNFLLGNK